MIEKELNVRELPTFPQAHYTGELGIVRVNGRWERNGQQLIGPLSKLILEQQPPQGVWVAAAMAVTGWELRRVFAFQSALSGIRIAGVSHEAEKGITDAALYGLLYKLARRTYQAVSA